MCFGKKEKKGSKRGLSAKEGSSRTVKVILCGNSYVGKTSITARYKSGLFKEVHDPTIAATYQEKKVKLKSGEELQFNIWDTAGDERFRAIMPLYYREAEIALLIFDLTEPESFRNLDSWIREIDGTVNTEKMVVAIVGNKCDLASERKVSREEVTNFASSRKMLWMQTSAKTGEGVDALFERCAEQHLKK